MATRFLGRDFQINTNAGDGNTDILWRNDSCALAEWMMNGNRIVSSVTPSYGGTAEAPDASWHTQAKPTNFG